MSTAAPPLPAGEGAGGWGRAAAKKLVRTSIEHSPLSSRLFWRVPAASGVALTFDDGPDPDQTPRILDTLAEHGAHATFFVIGEYALRYPAVVRRIVEEGHEVGNHTYYHSRCRRLSDRGFRSELEAADLAIRQACPEIKLSLFRPPFGDIRAGQVWDLVRQSRRVAFWSRDSRDYRDASREEIEAVGRSLQERDILLLHDRFPATVEALPGILTELKQRGLTAVALGRAREGEAPAEPQALRARHGSAQRTERFGSAGASPSQADSAADFGE